MQYTTDLSITFLLLAGGGKSARTVRSAEFEIQKLQTAEEVKQYVEQHGV